MSDKSVRDNPAVQKALQQLAALTQRANNGDAKARVELAKVQAGLARLNLPALIPQPQPRRVIIDDPDAAILSPSQRAMLAKHAVLTPPDDPAAVESMRSSLEGETLQDGDQLDLADEVARETPTADELAHRVHLRNHAWRGLNDVAKFVRTAPPSILQGTLGNQALLQPNPFQSGFGGGNILGPNGGGFPTMIPVVQWAGADAEATTFVVNLSNITNLLTSSIFDGPVRAVAIIQFGTRGQLNTVEVDIGLGCQFTLAGSQINIALALESPEYGVKGFAPISFVNVVLAGMLSVGTTCSVGRVTRTRYMATVPALVQPSPITVNIPLYAKDFFIFGSFASTLALAFKDTAGVVRGTFNLTPAGTQMEEPMPIPRDAVTVTVTDSSGAITLPEIQFGLAL